jgi:hypothetical protein
MMTKEMFAIWLCVENKKATCVAFHFFMDTSHFLMYS